MHIPTGRNVPGDVHFHRDIPDRLGDAVISIDFHKICISYKSALRGGGASVTTIIVIAHKKHGLKLSISSKMMWRVVFLIYFLLF